MSLTNTTVKQTYNGDGSTTTFAIPFDTIVSAASQYQIVRIYGMIISAGGTLQLKWAQNTTNATATTLKKGSWLKVQKLDN